MTPPNPETAWQEYVGGMSSCLWCLVWLAVVVVVALAFVALLGR